VLVGEQGRGVSGAALVRVMRVDVGSPTLTEEGALLGDELESSRSVDGDRGVVEVLEGVSEADLVLAMV
jgi:hypothetical protein